MPPARRKPPTGPVRRPKVAGTTRPTTPATPEQPSTEQPTPEQPSTEQPSTAEPVATPSADKPAAPNLEKPAVTKPVDAEESTAVEPVEESAVRSADPVVVRRLTIAFAVAAVLVAIFAVVAFLQPGTNDVENAAWVDDPLTSEVTAAATTALQTVFSYKFDTIDEDQANARSYLAGDRLDEYNETADQTKEGVLQTQTVTTATVSDSGVSNLQGDRAEVVVSLDISATQNGVDQGTVQTPVTVTMEKVDGKWLLSEIDNR